MHCRGLGTLKAFSAKSFDGKGNYSVGIKEQFIFPEIEYDKVESVHGLDITICTTAKTDKESKALLTHMGMPFRKEKAKKRRREKGVIDG